VQIYCSRPKALKVTARVHWYQYNRLINRHPAWQRCSWSSMLHIWQLCEIIHFFVVSDNFPSRHERFEALVKVVHADTCVDYCQDNENDCQNGEYCEGSFCRFVLVTMIRLIYADQLEKEIRESGMVKDDVDNHANLDFPPCPD